MALLDEIKPNNASIRTMQSDLKKIRESKQYGNKAFSEAAGKPKVKIFEFAENGKKNVLSSKQSEQNEKPITEKEVSENVKINSLTLKVPKPKIFQDKEAPINKENQTSILEKAVEESVIKDKQFNAQEKIKQIQDKIRPILKIKEVSAPNNIIKVIEPENKEAIQYAESLSRSVKEEMGNKAQKVVSGEEAIGKSGEYLPPELRLYRDAKSIIKNSANASQPLIPNNKEKSLAEAKTVTDVGGKAVSFRPMGMKKWLRVFWVIGFILIVAVGIYFFVFKRSEVVFKPPVSFSPTPTVTPSLTPTVQEITISNTIYIKNPQNLKEALFNLSGKEVSPISKIAVIVNNVSLSGDVLLENMGILVPENIKNNLNINNYYLLYFSGDNRLGLMFEVKGDSKDELLREMKSWENAIDYPVVNSLSPLLLGNFYEVGADKKFNQTVYKDITLYYLNSPDATRSIDYAVIKGFLIITTSKGDMAVATDEINK